LQREKQSYQSEQKRIEQLEDELKNLQRQTTKKIILENSLKLKNDENQKLIERESKLERNLQIIKEEKDTFERKIGFLQNVVQ
jgi:hypothetical protein